MPPSIDGDEISITESYGIKGLLAVQMAKSICIESKKKNMTSSEMDAPRGRHSACMVSNV